jgi:hypothetical protein
MSQSASQPAKTNPAPNFFSTYSVILPVNLQTAYTTFGTAAGHNRVCHLSKLCANLKLLEKDEVTLPVPDYPEGKKLSEVGVRTASATTISDGSTTKTKTLTRQHFSFEENVPIFFGLYIKKVKIAGTLTWDDSVLSSPSEDGSPVEALYESFSDSGGVQIWKLRTFEKVDGEPDKTRITERIEGWAPALLKSIVQNIVIGAHHAHMDQYHTIL